VRVSEEVGLLHEKFGYALDINEYYLTEPLNTLCCDWVIPKGSKCRIYTDTIWKSRPLSKNRIVVEVEVEETNKGLHKVKRSSFYRIAAQVVAHIAL